MKLNLGSHADAQQLVLSICVDALEIATPALVPSPLLMLVDPLLLFLTLGTTILVATDIEIGSLEQLHWLVLDYSMNYGLTGLM